MPRRRPPAYLRHKARNLGYSRIEGKQVYFPSPWNSAESLAAYDAKLVEWRKDADRNKYPWTVADLAAAYSDHAEIYYRKHGEPTRQVANIKAALRLLIQAHRHTLVCEMDLPLLKKWRDSLIGLPDRRCKRKRRQLSRQYINKITIIVLRMFRWARQEDKVSKVQLADLQEIEMLQAERSAAPEAPKIRPVDDTDVDAVLPFLPPPVKAMVQLQRIAGMRPGEVMILRPCDVTVRTDGVMVYRPSRWKTEHLDCNDGIERLVMLGSRAQTVLRPFLVDRDSEAYCFAPAEAVTWHRARRRAARKTPVQPSQVDRSKPGASRTGHCYTSNSYAQAIARACVSARVKLFTPNQLRKAASLEIMDKCDLDTARAQLGHRSVTTTAKHYATRMATEKAAAAARRIG